jgi:hypothetical protein
MTLKSITLHRPATDNVGAFKDAGTELTVGDAAKADFIDGDRARELVSGHGASGHYAREAAPRPQNGEGKKKAAPGKAAPAKAAPAAPVPPASAPIGPTTATIKAE